jgi:xanthine dehydrogenase accessory factor
VNQLLADLKDWRARGERIALATLVAVRGSAPRLPGARMGLTRSAKMSGSVSAGCVENDLLGHAMQVLDAGRPALLTYRIADEQGFEVGLSCGGSIDVLIEPFEDGELWNALWRAIEDREPVAWAIGLAPDALRGRKLLVPDAGPARGGIDADLDPEVAAAARRLLPAGGAQTLARSWRGDEATVFFEAFPPPSRLFIVGATHAAVHLCRMAAPLGFQVIVVDPRSAFARAERFPDAHEVRGDWPDAVLGPGALDAWSYLVTLTHDFKVDIPALACALRSEARYIGALGSRRTHERRKSPLGLLGFDEAALARIRAPVGLDLGGRAPEEIALSILAEMLAVRYGRQGQPLSALGDRGARIHAGR